MRGSCIVAAVFCENLIKEKIPISIQEIKPVKKINHTEYVNNSNKSNFYY